MLVKEIIEILSKFDPEARPCVRVDKKEVSTQYGEDYNVLRGVEAYVDCIESRNLGCWCAANESDDEVYRRPILVASIWGSEKHNTESIEH